MDFLPEVGMMAATGETTMRRPQRNHTPAFNAKVALAAVKGKRTLAELATGTSFLFVALGQVGLLSAKR